MKNSFTPELSIIIPFHNNTVINTLVSLEGCAYIDKCEVILVSDGLGGSALDDIKRWATILNLKIITADKCGRIGHLRNIGIGKATALRFYFIDSDCQLEKNAIEMVLFDHGDYAILKGRNIFIGRNCISQLDAQLREERYDRNPTFPYCPNLVVHADVFKQLGFFNSQLTYGSDGEFAKRVSDSSFMVKYNKEIVLYHDCTNSFSGVYRKWMNIGEARYYRYQNENVNNKLATYFPNLFSMKRGALYNCIAILCNVGRAMGMIRAWQKRN